MKYLAKAEMEKINTKRLLAYKNRLCQVPSIPDWAEDDHTDYDTTDGRFTKSSPKWAELYTNVKAILATREHIERDK
jgi:hypothetical protein